MRLGLLLKVCHLAHANAIRELVVVGLLHHGEVVGGRKGGRRVGVGAEVGGARMLLSIQIVRAGGLLRILLRFRSAVLKPVLWAFQLGYDTVPADARRRLTLTLSSDTLSVSAKPFLMFVLGFCCF